MEALIYMAGAIAWVSTALVLKAGPFNMLTKFRTKANALLGEGSPFHCPFCSSFWVGLVIMSFWATGIYEIHLAIQFVGVLGVAAAIRGASGEW